MNNKGIIIFTGALTGIISLALVFFGNPANMGFCIACFLRDTAGGLGLHKADVVQYVRPEIIGLVLGAFIIAFISKEFSPKGGSSPITRFVLGFCVMVGALMFLGCPLRMMLRIAGGDLNAVIGLGGFIVGILVGIFCLNKGFTLKRAHSISKADGVLFPLLNVALLIILIAFPVLLVFSEKGPGSMHAPIAIALVAGLLVGAIAQKSRFCTVGGIRDAIMFKDFQMLLGFITLIIVVAVGNMILGNFNLGFVEQPIAHTDGLWNFMGMLLSGFGVVLLGGCPMRQLILAGEGNSDSVITIFGLIAGAAFCHNFKLASSADGPSAYGPTAVIICLIIVALIAIVNIKKTSTQ